MIKRRVAAEVAALLDHVPAVALLGPRQSGKTTLALNMAEGRLYSALADLNPKRALIAYPGPDRYPLAPPIEAIGLAELCEQARMRQAP